MSDTSSEVQVLDEKPNYKSISCFQIPESFLDSKFAKEHFSQFGKITRFILRPSRFSCTVEYDSEISAENAKTNGKVYKGYQFNIKYTPQEITVKPKVMDPDPDVLDELNAMSGGISKTIHKVSNPLEKFLKPNRGERQPAAQYAYKSMTNRSPVIQVPSMTNVTTPPPPKPQQFLDNSIRMNAAALQARADLESVATRPALTAADKLKVLDLRDKYLRHILVRNTDIKKAQSTKGTCRDMCPEKERWMREDKMQIASYEYLDDSSQIDHQFAVKQYSRSSADQETPQPHELRSEEGLKLTMLYLLHSIVGLCDDPKTNLSDWYHFVWDRTRSIRKDIIQQELLSVDAVELIEKCARFHIHCSARLISEDASVFDHKINTENLTKCLQSLKYMYNDLNLRGVICRNEAEFRAYVILLNLNDGNFLWEIKQLPSAVFKSPEIRFALNVYFAIQNNSYVKFFKLLRQTTYMNACILMRYFNQVRGKALEIMVKAFASRAPVNFTISSIKDLLAFEDNDTACVFLEYYGLSCSPSANSVKLDRKMFEFPDMPFILDRAMQVVESKQTKSVGETICGWPLEPMELVTQHSVHNSFTKEGYLKQDAWLAEDQNGKIERPALDTVDFRSPTAKLSSPGDDHVFKKPSVSPPISPKTVLTPNRSSIAARLGAKAEKPSIFGKPSTETISGITPIFNKTPVAASTSSIFAPAPTATPIMTTSIFGGAANKSDPNNIFASAFSSIVKPTVEPEPTSIFKPPTSGSIFGGQQFVPPAVARWNIFATKEESLTGAASSSGSTVELTSPVSISASIFESPSVPDLDTMSESGAESGQVKPSPRWSQDSEDGEDDLEEEEEQDEDQDTDDSNTKKQQELEIRRKLEEKLEREKQKIVDATKERIVKTSENIYHQLVDEITKEKVETISEDLLTQYKVLETIPPRIYDEVLGELILDEVLDVALEETVLKQVNLKLMRRNFRKWRLNVRESIDRMRQIEKTPCWLPEKSMKEQAKEFLHPSQELNLFYMTRYLKGSPMILKYPNETVQNIDIFNIVAPKIFAQAPSSHLLGAVKSQQKFWKLTISTPYKNEENQSDFYNYIDKFLAKVFRTNDEATTSMVKRDIFLLQQQMCPEFRKLLSICVRQVRGRKLIDEFNKPTNEQVVQNSNGLLFFMTALSNKEVTRERLHKCLETAERWGPVPLTIIVYESTIEHITIAKIIDLLGLEELLEQEKITDFEIVFHSTQQVLQRSIETGIQFLAKNYSFENSLEMQSQLSFLSICLGEELWLRFECSKEQNRAFALSSASPNYVMELYNQAIQRVINIVRHNFQPYPDFPDELRKFVPKKLYDIPLGIEFFPPDWKSESRQTKLSEFLEAAKLPPFPTTEFSSFQTLDTAINRLVHITLTDGRNAGRVANHMLQILLHTVEQISSAVETFAQGLQQISWIGVIKILASERLQEKWQQVNHHIPIEVVYNKNELESYTRTLWWLTDSTRKSTQRVLSQTDEPLNKRPRVQTAGTNLTCTKEQMEEILTKGELTMRRATEKIDHFREVAAETKEVSKQFDHTLYRQQKLFHEHRRMWEEHSQF